MPADRRAQLAARESELVRALHGGPTPTGLDERMIALASAGIARKRARQVAKAFPALVADLGPDYQRAFAAFAHDNPPPTGGTLADGLAFAKVAARERRLSDDARVERMVNAAGVASRRGRFASRRVPHLAATIVRRPGGIVVVAHVPAAGTRVLSLRVPR